MSKFNMEPGAVVGVKVQARRMAFSARVSDVHEDGVLLVIDGTQGKFHGLPVFFPWRQIECVFANVDHLLKPDEFDAALMAWKSTFSVPVSTER